MPTKIKVGGVDYEIPRMKFKQLKAIWPRMKDTVGQFVEAKQHGKSVDGITAMFAATDDAVFVVATAMSRLTPPADLKMEDGTLVTKFTPEWLDDALEIDEAQQLARVVNELMVDTGLVKLGKIDPAAQALLEEVGLSTATGTASSQSSSQPGVKAEAGSESKMSGT